MTSSNSYYEKTLATGAVRCIDDEIPFDIPESWMWVRFGNLSFNRDSERIPLSVSERSNLNKIYDYYGASGVIDKVDKYLFDKPLLLIGEDGANLINRSTPIAFIATGRYWVNNHAHVIDFISYDLLKYVSNFINAISLVDYITGTAQPKMNQEKMNSILIAIPPIQEQVRINDKITSISSIVEKYEKQRTLLDQLNNTIDENLKKSILQEAIQGKLVPQIESEGSAAELLEEIYAEKKRLVREGKLKASALKGESRIFRGDDNKYYEQIGSNTIDITELLPFEIPNNWRWCRLSNVIQLLSGRDLEPSEYNGNPIGIPYMTGASNFSNGKLLINRWTEKPMTISVKGDLLITCKGTIGQIAFNRIGEIHIARQIMALRGCKISLQYVKIFLTTIINILQKQANSMIPGISREVLLNTLLPLPPVEEQKRIVRKIQLLNELII